MEKTLIAGRGIAAIAVTLWLGACASKSSDVTAAYLSPTLYEGYSCRQLAEEAQRGRRKQPALKIAKRPRMLSPQLRP